MLVAGLCARRDLRGDLDGRGAGCQEHVGGLAVERPPGRHRDGLTDSLAGDVVPEREAVAALDKHPRVGQPSSSIGPSSVAGSRSSMLARSANENLRPSEAATVAASRAGVETERRRSRIVYPMRRRGQARLDQLGPTADDADQVLVPQARQQLDEHERAAVRALDEVEERVVGLGVHDVFGHLGHGGLAEWAEDDPLSAATVADARSRCGDAPSPARAGRQ